MAIMCTVFGVKPKTYESIIDRLANGNNVKKALLTSYANSKEFEQYVKDNATPNEKGNYNSKTIESLLKKFYEREENSIYATTAKDIGESNKGFSSQNALYIAQRYCANLLTAASIANNNAERSKKKTKENLILDVIKQIINNLVLVSAPLYEANKSSNNKFITLYKECIEKSNELSTRYAEVKQNINFTKMSIDDLEVEQLQTSDNNRFEEINEEIAELNEKLNSLTAEGKQILAENKNNKENIYIASTGIINAFGNEKQKNYSNLASIVRQNESDTNWFTNVFNIKETATIAKEYSGALEDIDNYKETSIDLYEEEIEDEAESLDAGVINTGWDREYTSYIKLINGNVRLYLSTIPILASNHIDTSYPIGDIHRYNLDTDNELGVNLFYHADNLLAQILSKCNFYNLDTFLDSLKSYSNIRGLEGLIKIYEDCINDTEKLNELYYSFRKCAINKAIVNAVNDGLDVLQSNVNISDVIGRQFDIINCYKFTQESVHVADDKREIRNALSNIIKNANVLDFEDIPDIDGKITVNANRVKVIADLYKYANKIYNAITIEEVENAILYNNDFANNIKNFAQTLFDLYGAAYNSYISIQNALNNYYEELKKYNNEKQKAQELGKRFKEEEPVYPITDSYYSTLYPFANKFAAILSKSNLSNIKCNSVNAEGNQSSDIICYSHITNILEMIKNQFDSGDKDSAFNSLEKLRKFVTQGSFYKYSTILFGSKAVGRRQGKEGLFIDNGTKVNPNAEKLLNVYLFNGIIDRSAGTNAVYSSMFKGDYFMATMALYFKNISVDQAQSNIQYATYVMRTPSDAGKNYLITGQKIDINDLYYINDNGEYVVKSNSTFIEALAQNFKGELNIFITQLNNIINKRNEKYYIKNDAKGLFERAHYNGEIIKNGRLTGNFFNFNKLYDINAEDNYDEAIKQILSLYGDSEDSLLVKSGKNGLRININSPLIKINEETGKFELDLTKSFKDGVDVDTKIKQLCASWVKNLIENTADRTKQYEAVNAASNANYSLTQMIDYRLNYALAYMEFDDIFEGSTKYYKDPQDFLKRAKEAQMGGNCYATNDLGHIGGELSTITVQNKKVTFTIGDTEYDAYNGCQAVTIENTVRPSRNAEDIKQEIYNINKEKGVPEKIATKIANFISKGYFDKTKTNDAQSYITIEEFARRQFAKGALNEYKDLLEKLMDPNIPVEEIDMDEVNARIQVQKNIYYDIQYDANFDCFYPRQIKNAEFVLIPKLLPEGSDLRKLYDIMHKGFNGKEIGQVNTIETSKAARKNTLTFWDNNGNIVTDEKGNIQLEKDINNFTVERYYYKNLYEQQQVPQHMQDAANKVAVQIIKKIIDNATGKKVQGYVNQLNRAYSANITNARMQFLHDMNWKLDENGDIKDINGGEPKFDIFYEKAKAEAQRLGLDSNFIDYVTLDENGIPKMPNWLPNISTKIENIFQSIFNNYITRQTIPGWHAAQVTSVGYSKDLKYHPGIYVDENGEEHEFTQKDYDSWTDEQKKARKITKYCYCECYLPRWSNKIPKNYDLNKLAKEGLDLHIGYRIPTEGKQSVTILKVVGFLDDAQGSTIIVPEEWVTQTGSDFDVDSVYGICYQFYVKNGELFKIKFDEAIDEDSIRRRYVTYIRKEASRLDESLKSVQITDQNRKDAIAAAKNSLDANNPNGMFHTLMEYSKSIFDTLDENDKEFLRDINRQNKEAGLSFEDRNRVIIDGYESGDEDFASLPEEYIDALKAIDENILLTKGYLTEYEDFASKAIKELYDKVKKETFDSAEKIAKSLNLPSFNEFKTWDIELQNTEEARNNRMVDAMINILNDPESREENYSRSNYDDLTDAFDYTKKLRGVDKTKRSTYDIFDQIDYMEEVIGGRQLKAFSVNRDTFNSICNRLQVKVGSNNAITVIYDLNEKNHNDELIYDEEIIKYSYNASDIDKGVVSVTFDQYAWSKTNRNIQGKLLTPYGSQTTAHILDAVKVGALFNENKYTFGVFKTLIDLGVDYYTAIKWLSQDGMSRIVKAANEVNSVFVGVSYNPVTMALKQLLIDSGYKIDKYDRTSKVIELIKNDNRIKRLLNKYYNISIDDLINQKAADFDSTYNSVINDLNGFLTNPTVFSAKEINDVSELIKNTEDEDLKEVLADYFGEEDVRLNEIFAIIDRIPVKGDYQLDLINDFPLVFNNIHLRNSIDVSTENTKENADIKFITDLVTILQFGKLKNMTNRIENIMRCCNPDKFGAKQTVKDTRDILENIEEYRKDFTLYGEDKELYGNEQKSLLDLLYPIINGKFDPTKSKYQYVATYLKESTQLSVKVNSNILEFEKPQYVELTKLIENRIGKKLNSEEYKAYHKYLCNYIYSRIPILNRPVTITKDGFINVDDSQVQDGDSEIDIADRERERIYGFNTKSYGDVIIKDVQNPTENELNDYKQLSPANKIAFIRENFKEAGIFSLLELNTYTGRDQNAGRYTTITYNDQITDIETIIQQFKLAYGNKNILFRLGAIDLIKYAFLVDGFAFKRRGISKIIHNSAIKNPSNQYGMGILANAEEILNELTNGLNIDDFTDRFVRSHSDIIRTVKIEKPSKNANTPNAGNLLNRNIANGDHFFLANNYLNASLIGRLIPDTQYNSDYIKISRFTNNGKNRKVVLYKINRTNTGYYFMPMNILEENETSNYSINNYNNNYYPIEVYEDLADKHYATGTTTLYSNLKDETAKVQKRYVAGKSLNNRNAFDDILSQDSNGLLIGGINKMIKDINDYYSTTASSLEGSFIILNNNSNLNKLIPSTGTIQEIELEDGTKKLVKITPVSKNKYKTILKKQQVNKLTERDKAAVTEALNELEKYPNKPITRFLFYEVSEVADVETVNAEKDNTVRRGSVYSGVDSMPEAPHLNISTKEDNQTDIITTAQTIYNEAVYNTRKGSIIDQKFIDAVRKKGIDFKTTKSIESNKQSIYIMAANKYKKRAEQLRNEIKEFTIHTEEGTETYPIDSDELFETLVKTNNQEDINRLLQLVLKCKTFGDSLDKIFSLGIEGEDVETRNSINNIRDTIKSITNNSSVNIANDKIFDILFKAYSTNPLITTGLLKITNTYTDTNWFDLNLADAAEINNKQVQLTIKKVNSMYNKALLDADIRIEDFNREYDRIMSLEGEFDWNKVIDSKGRYGKTYTDEFYEEYQKVNDEYDDAIDKYGINSIEAEKAHIKKLKFYAENIEQEYAKEYYDDVIANIERILNTAPKFYIRYKELTSELYAINTGFDMLTSDTRKRIIEINKELRKLSDPLTFDDYNIIASDENGIFDGKIDDEAIYNSRLAMQEFIKRRKEINDKYFEYEEDEEFNKELNKNLAIIKEYESKHMYEPFNVKMENDEFRKAYEWVQFNTYESFSKEDAKKIKKAFDTLSTTIPSGTSNGRTSNFNQVIKNIIDKAKSDTSRAVVDEYGIFHPERLTKDEVRAIRRETIRQSTGLDDTTGINTENNPSGKLIKDIDPNLPVYKSSTFKVKDKENDERSVSREKNKIVGEINTLISKGVDRYTGHISFKHLERNLTEDELNRLGELYDLLKTYDAEEGHNRTTKLFKIKGKKLWIGTKLNRTAFNEEYDYYKRYIKGTHLENVWNQIFTENDGSKNPTPNFDIYGYFYASNQNGAALSAGVQNTLIDEEKTAAKRFINENIEFVPNQWYYEQQRFYKDYGYETYDEWFEANHYYDQFTHKIVPLKIWTEIRAKENSSIVKSTRVKKDNILERGIKDEFRNNNYKRGVLTYREHENSKFANSNTFSDKEQQMINLLKSTALQYGVTRMEQAFTNKGYAPRRRKAPEVTGKYAIKQVLGLVGIEYGFVERQYDTTVDYLHQHEVENDMMHLLKSKDTMDYVEITPKRAFETDEQYRERVNQIKEENRKIAERNLRVDNVLFDNNWKEVFNDFIKIATVTEAKERSKDTIFLTIEDLKNRTIPVKNRYNGNLIKNTKQSTDTISTYKQQDQANTLELFQSWARRFLYNQYKKGSNLDAIAGLMQNITSAKYMILNLPGGISNIATGLTNIAGEIFAKEYFDAKDFAEAQAEYFKNLPSFMADIWNTKSDNLLVAICKRLNVVDYDAIVERKPGEGYSEYISRIEELLYGFQSGGEHYMQNTAMIAMLHSHRLFKKDGKWIAGNFNLYSSTIEYLTLEELIDTKYKNLKESYDNFRRNTVNDENKLRRLDELKDNFVISFIKEFGHGENSSLSEDYIALRNKNISEAKHNFETLPTLFDQFTLKNGIAVFKEDSVIYEGINFEGLVSAETSTKKQNIANALLGYIKEKSQKVNNKIHGVYYKLGSAKIENEWWGSLVMQYHKHIYPGIMKRYRTVGRYSELRESNELGSYVSLAKFLSIEFNGIGKRIKQTAAEQDANKLLIGIQEVIKATADTFINLKINWNLLPEWERANVRRTYGDICGITAAMLTAVGVHIATDEDELREDSVKGNLLSTIIYLSDRLYSESRMYTPLGMYNEFNVLWSSPIAATNGPEDLLKGLNVLVNTLFNEDYEPVYTTGLYKGQNKAAVVFKRNIPAYRVINRLSHMSKNNQYYRINDNSLNMRAAKNIANIITNEDID